MTDTSVDRATVELEEVTYRVGRGEATVEDLVRAQGAVEAARLIAAAEARVAEVQATQATLDEAAGLVAWLDGPEHVHLAFDAIAAYRQAVEAHRRYLVAWDALGAARRRRFRKLRDLIGGGSLALDDGSVVSPRTGFGAAVQTPAGVWESTALRDDPSVAVVEQAQALHRGRPTRGGLAARLAREFKRGGQPLDLALDDPTGPTGPVGVDDDGPRAA